MADPSKTQPLPASGYGAQPPSAQGYGAQPYGAPPPQYGYPPPQGYGAYGAPPTQHGQLPPQGYGVYGAPPPQWGQPPPQAYGAPPYGAPLPQYGQPPPTYGAYGAPPAQYGQPPPQGYGAPPPGAPPAQGVPPQGTGAQPGVAGQATAVPPHAQQAQAYAPAPQQYGAGAPPPPAPPQQVAPPPSAAVPHAPAPAQPPHSAPASVPPSGPPTAAFAAMGVSAATREGAQVTAFANTPVPSLLQSGSAATGVTVNLAIQCSDLMDKDRGRSKSDPCVRVLMKASVSDGWHLVGETETLRDNLNPEFLTRVPVQFHFEQPQLLLFEVVDVDPKGAPGTSGDCLGRLHSTMGDLMGSPGNKVESKLEDAKKGRITVFAEPSEKDGDSMVELCWGATKLKSMDGPFGKSDGYLKIYALDPSARFVAETNVVNDTSSPTWRPLLVSMNRLCGGNENKPILVKCFDHDTSGNDDLIGSFECSLAQLMRPTGFETELIPPKKSHKSVGSVRVVRTPRIRRKPSFSQLLYEGLEISLMVAIDWTASNGAPSDSKSLHYFSPDARQQNAYETALTAVGSILLPYDRDHMIPAFGFGGRPPGASDVSHCFPLSGVPQQESVYGVQGLLAVYKAALGAVALSGPTMFSSVVQKAMDLERHSAKGPNKKYTVLLILTDGEIHDMTATQRLLARASESSPLSVIIVGVGSANFTSMEVLDGDGARKSMHTARDVVQFVPFSKFSGPEAGPRLAAATLAEVPTQVSDYFFMTSK